MAMSKKDYVAVAAVLRKQREQVSAGPSRVGTDLVDDVSRALADLFFEENENFDDHKFLRACGI